MRLATAVGTASFHSLRTRAVTFALLLGCALLAVSGPCYSQANPNAVAGMSPYATFHEGEIDAVGLAKGLLDLHAPLFHYPQRGGKLQFGYTIRYIPSSPYETKTCPPKMACYLSFGKSAGEVVVRADIGPLSADPGQNIQYRQLGSIAMSDLTSHPLVPVGSLWRTADATGMVYNPTTSVVTDRDGIQYTLGSSIKDPNGNTISLNASTGTWTDTLGRTFPPAQTTTETSGCTGPLPIISATVLDVPGPNGGTLPVTLCYAQISISETVDNKAVTAYANEVQSIVLPNGTAWTFTYGDGDLAQITLPTGGTIAYTWDKILDCGQTQSVNPTFWISRVTSRTVNANDGTGPHEWTYLIGSPTTATPPTYTTTLTDPLGNQSVHTFTEYSCSGVYETESQDYQGPVSAGALLKTTSTTYNWLADPYGVANPAPTPILNVMPTQVTTTWPNGQVSAIVKTPDTGFDFGFSGQTQYVALYGNVMTEKEYDYGNGAPGALLRTTNTNYLAFGNTTYLTPNLLSLPSNVQTVNGAGTQVALTLYGYDESGSPQCACGNQTSIQRWLNTTGAYLITSSVYDSNGRVTSTKDPKGNVTAYGYSSGYAGSGPTSVTNALSQITQHGYDLNTGLLTSTTDPNGQVQSFFYDPQTWRATEILNPDGGQTNYCYSDTPNEGCAAGPPYQVTVTKKITSSLNLVETDIVDGMGRLSETELTSDGSGTDYTVTTYDADGRKASVTNPYRTTSDPTYGITGYQYDALNRPTLVTRQDGSTVTTAYCGSTTLVTDEAGKWRRSTADGLSRMIEGDEPNSQTAVVNTKGCPGGGDPIWVTTYIYDALDDLTSVVQGGSHARNFVFDSLKRLAFSTNPETGMVGYSYDADSNVQAKTDARGITITYSWDKLNRMTGRTYSNGDPTVGYSYDQTTCVVVASCYNIGHMTSMTDAAGSESFAYEKMGRLSGDQRTTLTITKHTSYIYNLDGSLQSLTYPSGNTVSYTMGGNGLPISVRDTTWGNILDTEAYTPWGAPSQALLPELVSEFEFYDVRLRPCWTVAAPGLAAPANGTCTPGELATPIVETSYSWSPNGDLLGSNNVARRGSQVYNYDQVNRIVGAQSPGWTLTFGVDQWGNLNSAVGTGTASSFTLSTDTNNHISTALFSYDASGNETHDATNAYTWNAESELLGNLYDGRGNRVDSGGGATLSWYGPNGELLEQTSSSPLSVTYSDFVYFNGARLARHDYQNKLYYYFTDQVNSTRVIAQGVFGGTTLTLCYDADFYPYGGEQRFTDTCDQNFKFDGKERDPLTGNDYFGARYYSSTYGRFLSPDWSSTPAPVPYANLSNPQTLNLYAFVSDNPESFADLDGHGRYPGQPPAPASPQACQKQGQGQCAPPAQAQSNPVLQVIEDTAVGAAKETANTVIDLANLINAPIDATLAKLDINFSFGQGSDLKASTPGEKGAMIGTGIVLAIASGGESKSVDAVNLGKALASEAQVAEKGSAIIGAGTNKALNQAARLSSEYGGNAADWSKMTSTAYRSADGSVISTHWYENVVSGIRAEYKSIIDSAPWK